MEHLFGEGEKWHIIVHIRSSSESNSMQQEEKVPMHTNNLTVSEYNMMKLQKVRHWKMAISCRHCLSKMGDLRFHSTEWEWRRMVWMEEEAGERP